MPEISAYFVISPQVLFSITKVNTLKTNEWNLMMKSALNLRDIRHNVRLIRLFVILAEFANASMLELFNFQRRKYFVIQKRILIWGALKWPHSPHCLKSSKMSHLFFWIFAIFTIFVLPRLTCLVTLFDRRLYRQKN